MELEPLFLSRVQFVWVVSFHILLPAFTMGLATFIAVLEGLHFFKRDPVYLRLSQYWLRIFGVSFGLGVVSIWQELEPIFGRDGQHHGPASGL
jgi:cytochrome bd ubiquinol oxidase subunit I